MQTHNLKRQHPNKKGKTVGRGGTRGKTAGRGTKGQNARAGHKKRPEIRDFIKRVPKLRGRGKNINTSIELKPTIINLKNLSVFKDGDVVSPQSLVKKGIIKTLSGVSPRVKILGVGEIKKSIKVQGCDVSVGAKTAILKVGGEVK